MLQRFFAIASLAWLALVVLKALGQIGWRANVVLSELGELAQSDPSPAVCEATHAAAQANRADAEHNRQRLHDSTFHWFRIPKWRRS